MASFRRAHELGADSVEIDILKTKDGHYVVLHDETVDRTTDGTGKVSEMTLDELRRLDAGSWFGSEFRGEKIPELNNVLDWAKDKTHLLIEVKKSAANGSDGRELLESIRSRGMSKQVSVMSFDHDFVERVEAEAPEIDTGVLFRPEAPLKATGVGAAAGLVGGLVGGLMASGNPIVAVATTVGGLITGALVGRRIGMNNAFKQAKSGTADNLMPHWSISSDGLVRAAHRNGKGVIPYTVDNPLIAAKQKWNGVDGLITNRPGLIRG